MNVRKIYINCACVLCRNTLIRMSRKDFLAALNHRMLEQKDGEIVLVCEDCEKSHMEVDNRLRLQA